MTESMPLSWAGPKLTVVRLIDAWHDAAIHLSIPDEPFGETEGSAEESAGADLQQQT